VLLAFWSPKGGSGTSVVAAATALVLARRGPCRLADLGGDLPAILGLPPEPSDGLGGWLAAGPVGAPAGALDDLELRAGPSLAVLPCGASGRLPAGVPPEAGAALSVVLSHGSPVILDAGRADHPAAQAVVEVAGMSVIVVRGCYLALRRAVRHPLTGKASGVVLVDEPGRVLTDHDVSEVLELPILARFPVRSAVARAVDAGVLACRLPSALLHPAEALVDSIAATAGRAA
jgi:hypothetical protein